MLTDAEIAALVGAVVVLANALASYLTNRSSRKRAATTQAKVDALHLALTGKAPTPLVDGHTLPPWSRGGDPKP